jgi:hypothetical protein
VTVTSAQSSVDAIVNPEAPATGLTAALNGLSGAQTAEADFLEAQIDSELLEGSTPALTTTSTSQNVRDAIDDVLSTNADPFENGNALDLGLDDFAGSSKTLQDASTADAISGAETTLATEQGTVEDGTLEALDQVIVRRTALEEAEAARLVATTAYSAEEAKFDALNATATVTFSGADNDTLELGGDAVASLSNGAWSTDTGVDISDFNSYGALLSALQAETDAIAAESVATTALQSAIQDVVRLEQDDAGLEISDFTGLLTIGGDGSDDEDVAVDFDATFDAGETDPVGIDGDQAAAVDSAEAIVLTYSNSITLADDVTGSFVLSDDGEAVEFVGEKANGAAVGTGDAVVAEWDAAANAGAGGWVNGTGADTQFDDIVDGYDSTGTSGSVIADIVNNVVSNLNTDEFDPTSGVLTSVAGADAQDVLDAQDSLDTLTEAVEAFEAIRALNEEADGLGEAVTEAEEAITDDVADGGLGITLLSGGNNFTAESDVYLVSDASDGQNLNGFGSQGEDKIFFGEGYSLVQIPDGDSITDNVGDSGTLEILWEQSGSNLILYVEDEAFAGNVSTQTDMTEITLTGFSATDITSFADGFLSAGEVA